MRNPKFMGVYTRKGAAKRQDRLPTYFVWRLPNGEYAAQELDQAYTAKGPAVAVPAAAFEAAFRLEPSILAAPVVTPDFSDLAFPQKRREAPDDAEMAALERARRARQVENDLRASFSRALKALSRSRDRKAAISSIELIAATKKGIAPEHKHMFRDFGVALRKKSLYGLALSCAARAIELSPNDDHARFNYARLLGLLGRYDEAEEQLAIARKIDPAEKVYGRLERHLEKERQFAKAVNENQDI